MEDRLQALEHRLTRAERSLRRARALALGLTGLVLAACTAQRLLVNGQEVASSRVEDVLIVRKLVVIDAEGRPRIFLGGDAQDTQRISPSFGLVLIDESGAERFGVGVTEANSVTMGFDAPHGVGAPMRDRIGLGVEADGSASVMLIDNKTLVPVALRADSEGGGGLEFVGYDIDRKQATVLRTNFEGQTRSTVPLGDAK